jgi:hypothetical protein
MIEGTDATVVVEDTNMRRHAGWCVFRVVLCCCTLTFDGRVCRNACIEELMITIAIMCSVLHLLVQALTSGPS